LYQNIDRINRDSREKERERETDRQTDRQTESTTYNFTVQVFYFPKFTQKILNIDKRLLHFYIESIGNYNINVIYRINY
jgi:hypothetical protein